MRKNERWEIQKREISRAIQDLSKETEFGLVFYGAGSYAFRNRLVSATKANKGAALAFLHTRQMSLGTCLGPGVVDALRLLQTAKSDHLAVIVAGDGRPTRCPFVRGQGRLSPSEVEQLLSRTDGANPGRKAKVHTILVGTDDGPQAVDFMRRLAFRHRGTFRQINR